MNSAHRTSYLRQMHWAWTIWARSRSKSLSCSRKWRRSCLSQEYWQSSHTNAKTVSLKIKQALRHRSRQCCQCVFSAHCFTSRSILSTIWSKWCRSRHSRVWIKEAQSSSSSWIRQSTRESGIRLTMRSASYLPAWGLYLNSPWVYCRFRISLTKSHRSFKSKLKLIVN